ncbi:ATP-binding protein [Paenibacillus rubinfantis]|uniref:ATP-binding protein n=1 Tax=Paenibacillus rubinfantis TaxID=1720296 RepID=UPI00073E3CA5|nr:ATP-binding protein [Paenibacillus rubinfantis]
MEILNLTERVKNTIQLGESHFREFKSALEGRPEKKVPRQVKKICEDIGEALVSFANADGGELLVGVEDNGDITGVPHSEEDIETMLNAFKSHVHENSNLPMLNHVKLNIDGHLILFFAVAKGTSEIYQLPDGRCVRRQDKSTVPAPMNKILFERQEVKSREFDREFVDGALSTDLDLSLVQSMADTYLRGMSVEKYIQQIGLGEYTGNGLRLRRAALLLFAKDIQRWHPRSQVRIIKVNGTELQSGEKYNVLSDEIVSGNIFELLVKSWESLRPFLAFKTEFGLDAKFEQKYIYPELACREALVNAIAHRDYVIQNGIDVFIFDDRMEIKSPGVLLSTISLTDLLLLKNVHESRNSLIAKILRENKIMRELGEGMRRIFELMEEFELSRPTIASVDNYFNVTLYHRSVYSPKENEWLNLFERFYLSNLQKKIVVLGMNDRLISPSDIYQALNTNDRNIYDREVTALRVTGILKEIRTNAEASKMARVNNRKKQAIPRFKIEVPSLDTSFSSVSELAIFVANLPDNIDEESLEQYFRHCGTIERLIVPRDKHNGNKGRGFAFIWFKTEDELKNGLKLNGSILDGRVLRISQYSPPNKVKARRYGRIVKK